MTKLLSGSDIIVEAITGHASCISPKVKLITFDIGLLQVRGRYWKEWCDSEWTTEPYYCLFLSIIRMDNNKRETFFESERSLATIVEKLDSWLPNV